MVSGHPFQSANRHCLGLGAVVFFDPAAPTGGLARAVANTPEHARKDVAHPVDHVSVAVATLSDQPDVFGYGSVGRAGPLAINDLVEIGRVLGVGGVQRSLLVPQHGASHCRRLRDGTPSHPEFLPRKTQNK